MTNNKALIHLRTKPKKPVLKKNCKGQVPVGYGDSIETILDSLPDRAAYAAINFCYETEHDCGGEYTVTYFEWTADETPKDFEKRVEVYKKKIKTYNTWYKKNEDLIVLEEKRRVKLKKGRDMKTLEQLEAKVKREMEALERQRKKIGEQ
jgi:hypothetical protein